MIRVFQRQPLLAALLTLALLMPIAATAQDNNEANGGGSFKIGVVNRAKVFEEYSGKRSEMQALQKEAEKAEADLKAEIEKFDAAFESAKEKEDSLSTEEILNLQEEFSRMRGEIENKRDTKQKELDRKMQRLMTELRLDIGKAIEEVAVNEKFHLVLEADPDPRGRSSVIYFAGPLDITQKVIDKLNGTKGDD